MMAAALDLARHFAVFPLTPREKVPLKGSRGCLDATRDPYVIEAWWRKTPEANIGIACGTPSAIFVLDIDPRHLGDETLAELERAHGALPDTVRSFTAHGGEHRLFNYVDGIGNTAGKLGPGIDTRGDGGYIVAPPSVLRQGRRYTWDVDADPYDTFVADAPAWLIERLCQADAKLAPELPENWQTLIADGIDEGGRNVAVTRLTGLLLRKYLDPRIVLELVRCFNAVRCRPPLNDGEVASIVNSICGRELQRRELSHGR